MHNSSRRRRGLFSALLAFLVFALLAAIPLRAHRADTPDFVRAVTAAGGASGEPHAPATVALTTDATPAQPSGSRATPPQGDATHQAALVSAEDVRLRAVLRASSQLSAPTVLTLRGGLPTLVLPARAAPYTLADLTSAGAVIDSGPGFDHSALLIDSVFVAPGAALHIGGGTTRTLLLDTSIAGFTSIVAWDASLSFTGTATAPLSVTGWDQDAGAPAHDTGEGRPYIRAIGSAMSFGYTHVSALGFWSGRTGGVAWTGISSRASTGSAVHSSFTGNAYGAFVSRTDAVDFTADLFESNELDGLRLHRNSEHSAVSASASARNGSNGFVADRGATGVVFTGDVAINNGGNGFLLDGRSLVGGASPSGFGPGATTGTTVRHDEATGNGRTGILVEGGNATQLVDTIVCSASTGIALRDGAAGSQLQGDDVRCGGRVALSVGPGVTGTTVVGSLFTGARIGILVHSAQGVRLVNNSITEMSVFGISVHGASPGTVGYNNVIAGHGFRAVDARGGATQPALTETDKTNWVHRAHVTPLGYLRYHPILLVWVSIIAVLLLAAAVTKARRRPSRPYVHAPTVPAQPLPAAVPAPHPAPQYAGATAGGWGPQTRVGAAEPDHAAADTAVLQRVDAPRYADAGATRQRGGHDPW